MRVNSNCKHLLIEPLCQDWSAICLNRGDMHIEEDILTFWSRPSPLREVTGQQSDMLQNSQHAWELCYLRFTAGPAIKSASQFTSYALKNHSVKKLKKHPAYFLLLVLCNSPLYVRKTIWVELKTKIFL